jgi:hypothetical protein
MTGREHMHAAAREGVLRRERSRALRLVALVIVVVAALAIALGAMLSAAQAETLGDYTFTKVADSAEDGFDPFSFGLAVASPMLCMTREYVSRVIAIVAWPRSS